MKCFICIFFTVLSISGFAATTLEFKKDCDCKVEFKAEASPGFFKFEGKGGKILGKLVDNKGKVSGELTVSLADFDTDNETRNSHMKDKYLNVAKFPVATLKVSGLPSTDGDHKLIGLLTLHGKKSEITGDYTLKTEGKSRKLRATFKIDVTKFGIEVPQYQVLTVAKEVEVIVDAVATP